MPKSSRLKNKHLEGETIYEDVRFCTMLFGNDTIYKYGISLDSSGIVRCE